VVYIDPDIALFGNPRKIEALLDEYNTVLTPHQLQPGNTRQALLDHEIGPHANAAALRS
jgi:hypothetical protein